MAAPSILFTKARYIVVAVALETSLHFYNGIIGFVNEDLRFLQKAVSIQLLDRH